MHRLPRLLPLFALLAAAPAGAESLDPLIEGAKQCTRHLPRYEREYGIPTHLLSAIASTESGRHHPGLGIRVPWPWTINAEGKGYYFESKAEAIAAARKLRSQGVRSMDVGCMQVNMMHHPDAFASLEEAFEPQKNIAYAASFLRALFQETGSWKEAAGDYHSKTPARGQNYVGLVYNSWYQIIDKLRAARLKVPESSVAAMQSMKTPGAAVELSMPKPHAAPTAMPQPQQAKVVRPKPAEARTVSMLPGQDKATPAYRAPRMNSISVSQNTTRERESGVLIVRPEIKLVDAPSRVETLPNPITLAARAPEILPPVNTVAASPAESAGAKVIHVGSEKRVVSHTERTRPNFIFSD